MTTTVMERAPDVRVRPKRLGVKQAAIAGAALLIGAGAVRYGHDYWTVGRFIESTDDAYVGGDISVIAPKVSGFIAEVAV
ncbi:MAG: hemolysin, partial [Rhodopila sp.]|nr:hemolysin [Rhodopila sp.]